MSCAKTEFKLSSASLYTMKHRPRNISISRTDSILAIEWDDGHRSEYAFRDLRSSCPCAECKAANDEESRDEAHKSFELPLVDANSLALQDVKIVGNYALQLFWKDGHSFGIYSWDLLRSLCPFGDQKG